MKKFIVLFLFLIGCATVVSHDKMIDLHNQARNSRNIGSLRISSYLNDKAQIHSKWMADHNTLSHSQNGKMPWDRIDGYRWIGENIAESNTIEDAFKLWMGSQGHKDNILDKNYEFIGIGHVNNFWTVIFVGGQ